VLRRLLAPVLLSAAVVAVLPTPAQAAVVTAHQGKSCAGSEVPRCAWINLDTSNDRMRAYADVRDAAGGGNYDVLLNTVWVDEYTAGRWVERTFVHHSSDGWHTDADLLSANTLTCSGSRTYRVRMEAGWRSAGSTGSGTRETRTSKSFTC
jgi:hypothetical protein